MELRVGEKKNKISIMNIAYLCICENYSCYIIVLFFYSNSPTYDFFE